MPKILTRQKTEKIRTPSLVFQSPVLEDEYGKSTSSQLMKRITAFSIFYILYIIVLFIRETISMATHDTFSTRWDSYLYLGVSLLAYLIVLCIYFISLKKYPDAKKKRDMLVLIFSVALIVFYYTVSPHTETDDEIDLFWVGYNHQSFIIVLFFLLKTWMFKVVLIFFSSALAFGVNYSHKDNKYIIEIIFFLIVISYFIYQDEKFGRFAFKENYKTSQYKKSLDHLIQNLPDGVLLIDKERRVVYRNPAFSTLVGSSNTDDKDNDDFNSWNYLKEIKNLKLRDSPTRQRTNNTSSNKVFYKFKSMVANSIADKVAGNDAKVNCLF